MSADISTETLVLVAQNMELRLQLADLQEQLVEAAVDAGDLHAAVQSLQAQLLAAERERDGWRQETERLRQRLPGEGAAQT